MSGYICGGCLEVGVLVDPLEGGCWLGEYARGGILGAEETGIEVVERDLVGTVLL